MPIGLELGNDSDVTDYTDSGLSRIDPTPQPESDFLSEMDEWHYLAFGICITMALIFFLLIFTGVIK